MINVIDEKPIPIYEVTCPECASVIEYTAAEVAYSHITCPVCRSSMWAMTLRPKRYENRIAEKGESNGESNGVEWKYGEWLPYPTDYDYQMCSVCRKRTRRKFHHNEGVYGGYDEEVKYEYCPHCGVKMKPIEERSK